MHIEDVEYEVDGVRMIGHLATDDERSGRRPAVLLAHEGPGLDDHVKGRAEKLAALGYVAFALDYHGDGKPVPVDEIMTRLGPLMATTRPHPPAGTVRARRAARARARRPRSRRGDRILLRRDDGARARPGGH